MKTPTLPGAIMLLLTLGVVSCGGSTALAPTPTAVPVTASDFAGTWVQVDGGRTWNLIAGATPMQFLGKQYTFIQIAGTATISQDNHPSFGPISARGGMLGNMVDGISSLQFAETYDGVSTPLFPFPPNDCYIDTEGQMLTLIGNRMTVLVTEHDGCNGVRVRDATSQIVMQRQ